MICFFSSHSTEVIESEPEIVNVSGAQESIPSNRFRQAGNQFLGTLKILQIRAQVSEMTQYCQELMCIRRTNQICNLSFSLIFYI
jgi:hypothetical protein